MWFLKHDHVANCHLSSRDDYIVLTDHRLIGREELHSVTISGLGSSLLCNDLDELSFFFILFNWAGDIIKCAWIRWDEVGLVVVGGKVRGMDEHGQAMISTL